MPKPTVVPPSDGVNFGDLDFYTAGFLLPPGVYCLASLDVKLHQQMNAQNVPVGPQRLGVMITYRPLETPGEDHLTFYSMGSKANLSFMPNETGKGLRAIPGAPSAGTPDSTNWVVWLKSMYDTGLPKGVFINDLSVLEGTWVVTANQDEPAERAGFQNTNTGEFGGAERKRTGPNKIAVIAEIRDDGKPWENTGGIVEWQPDAVPAKAKAAAKVAPKVTKAAPKVNGRAVSPPPPAAESATDEDMSGTIINAIAPLLDANAKLIGAGRGWSKTLMRMATFKAIQDVMTPEEATAVIDTYFTDDEVLNSILNPLDHKTAGGFVTR